MDLTGRTVLVTGAGRGVGRVTAVKFAQRGANVALVARTKFQLEQTADEVRACGVRVTMVPADVGDAASVQALVQRVCAELGGVDVVVNNAGAAIMAPIESLTVDDWRTMVRTNLDGVFHVIKWTWPELRRRGGGIIINISSMAAFDPFPTFGAYAATKAAVNLLTHSLADEGVKDNIRLFAVCPGTVDTDMFRSLAIDVPVETLMTPAEVADFVVWLTDDRCQRLTGQSLAFRKRQDPSIKS